MSTTIPKGCETLRTKVCTGCTIEKSVEDFHRNKRDASETQSQCKACNKARLSTPENIERRKRYAWLGCLKKFGITESDYNEMFDRQLGLCAICHKPENDIKLAVDHNHDTDEVRGLLCKRCNMAIGLLGDNYETVLSAALYLKGNK